MLRAVPKLLEIIKNRLLAMLLHDNVKLIDLLQ